MRVDRRMTRVPRRGARHADATRQAGVAAAVAGLSWTLLAAESIAHPAPRVSRTIVWYLPWLATTVAVDRMHRLQSSSTDKVEVVGYLVNVWGAPVVAIGNALALRRGGQRYAAAAALTWTTGLVLFGIGTARARSTARWLGPAIAASQPLTVAIALALSPRVPLSPIGSYSGALAHGLVWLGIAGSLHRTTR